ncbi:uncharacterized protein JCM6883_004779 [Sporobolomyces salmoneus]|uniref:uncharacterized protein n=1 Tax=Sporobolomyces salmoneus TaxID=183962 RepID=UPI00316F16A2
MWTHLRPKSTATANPPNLTELDNSLFPLLEALGEAPLAPYIHIEPTRTHQAVLECSSFRDGTLYEGI